MLLDLREDVQGLHPAMKTRLWHEWALIETNISQRHQIHSSVLSLKDFPYNYTFVWDDINPPHKSFEGEVDRDLGTPPMKKLKIDWNFKTYLQKCNFNVHGDFVMFWLPG